MSQKAKLAIVIVAGLCIIGFIIHDIMTGDYGYRLFSKLVVIVVVGIMVYNYFSKKRESNL